MNNAVKKGTQSDNDVWVLHRTKDIKALVNAVNLLVEKSEEYDYIEDYYVHRVKEALKPFVKQKKDE